MRGGGDFDELREARAGMKYGRSVSKKPATTSGASVAKKAREVTAGILQRFHGARVPESQGSRFRRFGRFVRRVRKVRKVPTLPRVPYGPERSSALPRPSSLPHAPARPRRRGSICLPNCLRRERAIKPEIAIRTALVGPAGDPRLSLVTDTPARITWTLRLPSHAHLQTALRLVPDANGKIGDGIAARIGISDNRSYQGTAARRHRQGRNIRLAAGRRRSHRVFRLEVQPLLPAVAKRFASCSAPTRRPAARSRGRSR